MTTTCTCSYPAFFENMNKGQKWVKTHRGLLFEALTHNSRCFYHKETSQLIYPANHFVGFYVMGTLIVNG